MSKDTVGMSRARTFACFGAVCLMAVGASAQQPPPSAATPSAATSADGGPSSSTTASARTFIRVTRVTLSIAIGTD